MIAVKRRKKTVIGISRVGRVCHYVFIYYDERLVELFDKIREFVRDDRLDFTFRDACELKETALRLLEERQ